MCLNLNKFPYRGYLSPEYAVDGTFSEKSDVFSFGVLVLEIVSGKKNRGFSYEKDSDNLLAHVSFVHLASWFFLTSGLFGSHTQCEWFQPIND